MDVAKVAKDYFVSSQSSLLIPNRDFGSRKMFHLGITRSSSAGSIKLDSQSQASLSSNNNNNSMPGRSNSVKGLLSNTLGINSRPKMMRAATVPEENSAFGSEDDVFWDCPTQSLGKKKWLHPSEALTRGHILYTVKFLGECKVDLPKGTEAVKSAITKMKFNKHIKRAEGQKTPKVELTISADVVQILDLKNKTVLHKYPLHRISYCADDMSDKRVFTFIGKAPDSNDHYCYVFDSDKCSEEITLTIGQAFELAYQKFITTSTPEAELKKRFLAQQKKLNALQYENQVLKKRLRDLESLKGGADMEQYKLKHQLKDITTVMFDLRESSTDDDDELSGQTEANNNSSQDNVVGRRLENLMLVDGTASHAHTNGNNGHSYHGNTSTTSAAPILSPPPPNSRPIRQPSNHPNNNAAHHTNGNINTKLAAPVKQTDVFGMPAFDPAPPSPQELMDIHDGFSRGLSFGTDNFNIEDLDPLSHVNERL